MLLEAGRTYLNRAGEKVRINLRPTYDSNTKRPFEDEYGCLYYPDGRLFGESSWRSDIIGEYIVQIPRSDGTTTTLEKITETVEYGKKMYSERDPCFTWVMVEALVNKIKELEGIQ